MSQSYVKSIGKRESTGTWLGIGLAIGAAWLLFGRKIVAASNLTFYPGQVQSMQFVGATPVMTVLVQVQNTSSASLTINSFSGNVTSNGTLIGNVYNFLPVTLAPNSMQLVPVTLQLNATGIVNDIINIFQQNSARQQISVNASANVEGVQVPIALQYAIGS